MIYQRLRAETRVDHQRIETRIDLMGRDWSLPFYRVLLQKFYGFHAAIEPPVFAHSQWKTLGLDVEKRRKTGWLQRDLQALGLSEAEIAALPRCEFVPCAQTFAQALGCAYVMEGATLGGQIISRHLRQNLPQMRPHGCTFFSAYGPCTGAMWREFLQTLASYDEQNMRGADEHKADESASVQSACETFRALESWLEDVQ